MRGAGETQPCVWPTLRTNYGSGLSLFLATHPRGAVPVKMANHRVGGQRVGWRFGVIPAALQSARAVPGSFQALMNVAADQWAIDVTAPAQPVRGSWALEKSHTTLLFERPRQDPSALS